MKDKSLVENNGSTENVRRTKIVVGLDIGTTKIACFVGKKNDHGKIEILSMGRSESLGVMSGVVSNIKQTVESIILAVTGSLYFFCNWAIGCHKTVRLVISI